MRKFLEWSSYCRVDIINRVSSFYSFGEAVLFSRFMEDVRVRFVFLFFISV